MRGEGDRNGNTVEVIVHVLKFYILFHIRGCKLAVQVKFGLAVMFCFADITFLKSLYVVANVYKRRNFTTKLGFEACFLKTGKWGKTEFTFPYGDNR